jgi:xanthine dehydrogenase small subunit
LIRFILNDVEIKTASKPGYLLLDLIRYQQHLKGTKIGCREGDCGACTVLIGEIKDGSLNYTTATSCLMAIGNAHGKHIVTIEGINVDGLNAVQQAFSDEGATQCGFCTPGFIVSLAGFTVNNSAPSYQSAINSMNGNICRCTGYKSIERAAKKIASLVENRGEQDPISFAVNNNILPSYFFTIKERLLKLQSELENEQAAGTKNKKFLGGGTDLYVQQHDTMVEEEITFLFGDKKLKGITKNGSTCEVGGAATVADIAASPVFREHFPALDKYIELVSSTQIRNMATVAGNFTNASPIGDLSILFLALNANLLLSDGKNNRSVKLKEFYKGYKSLDKGPEEFIEKISFELPSKTDHFNFEKVSKRTHLDIASVNSAMHLIEENGIVKYASIAAGGVGPVPAHLSISSGFLIDQKISEELITALLQKVQEEISPISDARGSAEYKRLLLAQLIKAHFITSFPDLSVKKIVQA